jgi:hypothetical protein
VDQILEAEGIPLVRIDNPVEAEKWGLEVSKKFYLFINPTKIYKR